MFRLMPWCAGFGGHSVRSQLDYSAVLGREVHYFTFLRNPVQRYLSHFNYQVHRMGISWTMSSFMEDRRFDDFMTHRLSSSGDVGEAKERLERDFVFVGLLEEFDASLILLRQALKMPEMAIGSSPQNVAANPGYGFLRDMSDVETQVRNRNAGDLELYAHARVLFARQRAKFLGDFDGEVEALRAANRTFKEDPVTRFQARATRLAWRVPEFVSRRRFHPEEDLRNSALTKFGMRRGR